ncbi:MAG TPA: 2-phosphosulfolactate phosphatase [Candidatus Hydrogenedentes bacterium]|nr:2-phosphosulfolactate phosphatase [Candidatus Hydrogenedentota bacterium]HQH51621.1 2-phosphosulfolactate phosphatase [Candidatus Hydrogenedentota bacterium]
MPPVPHIRWHIIEGAAGCAYARERGLVAVVVDALRASATAAMLFDAGATEILAVREVSDAHAARPGFSGALLYGERGGLPPEGFDFGNSPRTVEAARGRRVIFTTTTGAGRLLDCWGAEAAYMGSTVNAAAVVRAAASHEKDVVLIPAGLVSDPFFNAQEDWTAAAAVAMRSGHAIGQGAAAFDAWRKRIEAEGLEALFQSAPHAEKLRRVGLEADISYCAQMDLTAAVPKAVKRHRFGVILQNAVP